MQLRDPGPQFVRVRETQRCRWCAAATCAFDALFALAGHEMRQDSVDAIRDGNYNGGAPIPCDCFETGEKWHYVWTRDLSYAADLGAGHARSAARAQFARWIQAVRLARRRRQARRRWRAARDGLQIVQDTGSGGSWPVSTDRVAWAFAAEDVLDPAAAGERAAPSRRRL